MTAPTLDVHLGDNLEVVRDWPDGDFDLVYLDPPFNTGRTQERPDLRITPDADGNRTGFRGDRFRIERAPGRAFEDRHDDFLGFLVPRLEEAHRLLAETGSLFLHLDYREVHYAKVALDGIFGRRSFVNEIVWAYDYGGRTKKRWSPKHDNILWYAKDPRRYTFRYDDVDRVPYMAPRLVTPEKRERGKTPTDTWWHTIVSPTGREKTGYPTQKPLGVLNRIVRVHSNPGDRVLDLFAGSGTTGEAAVRSERSAVLVDESPDALEVMAERLAFAGPRWHGWAPSSRARRSTAPRARDRARPG